MSFLAQSPQVQLTGRIRTIHGSADIAEPDYGFDIDHRQLAQVRR